MSDDAALRGAHAPGGPAAARAALIEWVREAGAEGRLFLQTHLRARDDGAFAVRHRDDRHRPEMELERITDPFRARLIAQTTQEGAHRPLKTAPNLRRGWRFDALDERGLWTVLDYLYPACVSHWHAGQEDSLRVTHWSETAARQSGMYSSVRLLPESAVRDTVRACCADAVCMRRVAWGLDERASGPFPPEPGPDAPTAAGETEAIVPCPEACSIFISFARAVLAVERAPRSPVPGLGRLNEPELEQIRLLIASAAAGTGDAPREGEFELPLNRRRLRYLATRLAREDSEDDARATGDG